MTIKTLELKPATGIASRSPLHAEFAYMLRDKGVHSNGIETMEDFWIMHGWYKVDQHGELTLTSAKWKQNPQAKTEAVRTLVEILGKDPRDVTGIDFYSNLLGGLLDKHYNCSPYEAIKEAFPESGIKAWEMLTTPQGFYKSKKNRIAATRWLFEKLGKDARDVTGEDFHLNRLGAMLVAHYSRSPYKALLEAGLISPADEEYIRERGIRRLKSMDSY